MVDSAPHDVACWSEDGETFVVKDPTKFEKEIIPQYFKHSKFSSFVRVSRQSYIVRCQIREAAKYLRTLRAFWIRDLEFT
jgi:hypothetical protein